MTKLKAKDIITKSISDAFILTFTIIMTIIGLTILVVGAILMSIPIYGFVNISAKQNYAWLLLYPAMIFGLPLIKNTFIALFGKKR